MGTELEFTMNEDNRLVTEDIYKEVANIICVYYKNTEDACRSTLSKVDENNPINGIRYVTSDNNILVYVNTAKSIDIENIDTYTEVTKTELSKTNYELKLDTETINNIKITNADTLITFTGNVTTTSESKNMSIVVTLYGDNDTKLTEEKYEFNDTNKLEENKEFKVEFTLNDTLNLDSIKAYSISIEKQEINMSVHIESNKDDIAETVLMPGDPKDVNIQPENSQPMLNLLIMLEE